MIAGRTVGVDELTGGVVKQDVKIVAACRRSVAIGQLNARASRRLQRELEISAPGMRCQNSDVDIGNREAAGHGNIANQGGSAGRGPVDRPSGRVGICCCSLGDCRHCKQGEEDEQREPNAKGNGTFLLSLVFRSAHVCAIGKHG